MHASIQRYHKYQLAVPLRLLPFSSVKHLLVRDVSHSRRTRKAASLSALPCPAPPQRGVATGAFNATTPDFHLTFALFTCDVAAFVYL